jgi:hypothetical protein
MSRAITCPSCGGTIGIKAAGYTVSVACLYCGTVLDVANPMCASSPNIIRRWPRWICRWAAGQLFGVEWEAIGWLEREIAGYVWQNICCSTPMPVTAGWC